MLMPEWKKTRRGYYAWECNWGNVISESKTSPEKALRNLVKALRNKGYDVTKPQKKMTELYRELQKRKEVSL